MRFSVIAFWRVAATPGDVCEEFFSVVNVSYTDEEFAALVVLSAKAAEHSF